MWGAEGEESVWLGCRIWREEKRVNLDFRPVMFQLHDMSRFFLYREGGASKIKLVTWYDQKTSGLFGIWHCSFLTKKSTTCMALVDNLSPWHCWKFGRTWAIFKVNPLIARQTIYAENYYDVHRYDFVKWSCNTGSGYFYQILCILCLVVRLLQLRNRSFPLFSINKATKEHTIMTPPNRIIGAKWVIQYLFAALQHQSLAKEQVPRPRKRPPPFLIPTLPIPLKSLPPQVQYFGIFVPALSIFPMLAKPKFTPLLDVTFAMVIQNIDN